MSGTRGDFEAVIGLEIHAQLKTKSKLFSTASTTFGAADNHNVTEVCLGMPGTLPVLNEFAVEQAIKTGLALNCNIQNFSQFARKQYFYPDLPKGYQISQMNLPLCQGGYVEFIHEGQRVRVDLDRAHMEEDAGKSTHHGAHTLVNLNRAGVPLLEIVSLPVIKSSSAAANYARMVRQILIYTDVCDGNMEEGSLRCDCNVSIRKVGDTKLGTKVELKNINSFRFIEKALDYEIDRQIDCLIHGESIFQETRLYDSAKNKTISMRSKEEAMDYRYFPDPDILPLVISSQQVAKIRESLPELPMEKWQRLVENYKIPEDDVNLLISDRSMAEYFEKTVACCDDAKAAANWLTGEFLAKFNESKMGWEQLKMTPDHLGRLIHLVNSQKISIKIAKDVFQICWDSGKAPEDVVNDLGLGQISDENLLRSMIREVLESNQEKVTEYLKGKEKLKGFFIGQIMKKTKGQGNPTLINDILQQELKKN